MLDYSTDVGPFTIVDQSGESNTATLYSGRGLTMDAVNDSVTYATGYSSASRTATLWGKFNTTSPVALVGITERHDRVIGFKLTLKAADE